MTVSTNLKIALSHLTSRVRQALVAVLSVTFGISMYIFMNSFMSGVNDTQNDLAFSTLAHIRIYQDLPEDHTDLISQTVSSSTLVHLRNPRLIQYTEGIRNARSIQDILKQEPEIAGVSSEVNVQVFFRNGATNINGNLSGVDVHSEDALFHTADYMVEGNWFDLEKRSDGIILGSGLAQKLSLGMDDKVTVRTSQGLSKVYQIIGIFETTIAQVDNLTAYIRIQTARSLISENPAYVSDIQINLHDYNRAEEIAQRLAPHIDYKVESWSEANGQLVAGSVLRNAIALAVSLTILLVAGFGIYNIMNMTVNEKIREIAILKAMGFDGKDIVQIFLIQSIIIGLLGGISGMGLGYVVSYTVNQIPFQIGGLENLPMTYYTQNYLMALGFGIITTFLAGYLPAYKASKVDPVSIIRS